MCRKMRRSYILGLSILVAAARPGWSDDRKETAGTAQPATIENRWIAHWTFDEPSGGQCSDSGGNGWHAAAAIHLDGIARQRGVLGNALFLSGQHMLRVDERIPLADPAGISLSAWVKPTELSAYREIFRKEDGNDRVLFSFQANGAMLSFGLNVGGYEECHARLDPSRVRDRRWHHCAATFDGRWMRVYFDGDEIGSLQRPGTIRAGGSAPACIGSSNGGECFQGALDDLRIYAGALGSCQIAMLHRQGREMLEQASGQLTQQIRAVYQRGHSFAETIMGCRRRIVEQHCTLDADLATAVIVRLKTDFPDDYDRFLVSTDSSPGDFLADPDPDGHRKAAERLLALLLEYKPLTEQQWKKQTAEELRKWEEVEAIRAKLEKLKAQGDRARFSPQWITFLLETAPRVQFRPRKSEAVAPYVPPATPPTRSLTAEEAQEVLRRDWLFQAGGNPSPARIREEIGWTRRLAARIAGGSPATPRFAQELAELDAVEQRAAAVSKNSPELYFQVRRIKRQIAMRNPAIAMDKILLVDMPFPQGREWRHETRHRLGYMAVPGGRLLVLQGLSPDGKVTQLMPQPPLDGSFWRPDVSYDGQRVVFCF